MKPTLDLNKPVQTRDGRKVTIISTEGIRVFGGCRQPIRGTVAGEPIVHIWDWCADGTFVPWREGPDHRDLVNVPEAQPVTSLDLSKPVQTRSGYKVTITGRDGKFKFAGVPMVLEGVIHCSNDAKSNGTWSKDGKYGIGSYHLDLVNVPEAPRLVAQWVPGVAPLDFTKPLQTRDGRKVDLVTTTGPLRLMGHRALPVVGVVHDASGWGESMIEWTTQGRFNAGGDIPSPNDLVNVPPPVTAASAPVTTACAQSISESNEALVGKAPEPPKFDFSKPVQTRDGRKAEVRYITNQGATIIVGKVAEEKIERTWNMDGIYFRGGNFSELDLVNAPTPEPPKLDLTKPVRTRDGRAVRILATDTPIIAGGRPEPVVGIIEGLLHLFSWTSEGSYTSLQAPHQRDLVNIPPPVPRTYVGTRWFNVYRDGDNAEDGFSLGRGSLTKEESLGRKSLGKRIAVIELPVTFTEGQGL